MPTGQGPTGSGTQWWIVLTTFTNSVGQPGSGYIIVSGTQAAVFAKYGGPSDVKGPYTSQAAAESAAKADVGSGPGSISKLAPGQPQLSGPGSPLAALFQANIWIRVAEVALGIILIAVGIARLTNAVPVATKIAGVAAKGALL